MTKCYILGAGASCGYDEDHTDQDCPPLTDEFFVKGTALGLFTERRYPRLFRSLGEYLQIKNANPDFNNRDSLRVDIEKLLSWLAIEFQNLTRDNQIEFERSNYLQGALSETFYFIYDLLRYYSLSYRPRFDCYRRLVLHYNDDKYVAITLNYDLLFETAANSLNTPYHYFLGPHHPKSIPIAKLHGSINWINPCTGGIAYGGLTQKDFARIITPIYSNKIHVDNPIVLPIHTISDIESIDFVRSGIDYDEPAIIPPLENYKDYEKVAVYKGVWSFAESMLSNVSELVIIGCSIRPQDRKFNELLSGKVKEGVQVTVVDKDVEGVSNRLQEVLHKPLIRHTFDSFNQYARTL